MTMRGGLRCTVCVRYLRRDTGSSIRREVARLEAVNRVFGGHVECEAVVLGKCYEWWLRSEGDVYRAVDAERGTFLAPVSSGAAEDGLWQLWEMRSDEPTTIAVYNSSFWLDRFMFRVASERGPGVRAMGTYKKGNVTVVCSNGAFERYAEGIVVGVTSICLGSWVYGTPV